MIAKVNGIAQDSKHYHTLPHSLVNRSMAIASATGSEQFVFSQDCHNDNNYYYNSHNNGKTVSVVS